MFAPIGVCAAFYVTAKPGKKKKVLAILIPVLITAVFTGITEPLEFTFLFVAPILYVVILCWPELCLRLRSPVEFPVISALGLIQNASRTGFRCGLLTKELSSADCDRIWHFLGIYFLLFAISDFETGF